MTNERKQISAKYKFSEPHFRLEDLDLKDSKYSSYSYANRHIEPEQLSAIYQQAFIYNLLYNFAKEHLPDVDEINKRQSPTTTTPRNEKDQATDTTIDKIKEKVIEYLFEKSSVVDENLNKTREQLADEIWNTDDLAVLRKSFALIKENNIILRSQLVVFEEENKRLKERLAAVEITSRNALNEKLSLEQENERMYIRIQDLESRYQVFHNDLVKSDHDKQTSLEEILKLKYQKQELELNISRLEFVLNNFEDKFKSQRVENNIQLEGVADSLKAKHNREIHALEEKYAELEEKYNDKKLNSLRTQKALEQLRTHFMLSCGGKYEKLDDKIDDSFIN